MLYISNYSINIPQGAFLQASKEAETSMINKLLEYVGHESGKIVDCFYNIGFSLGIFAAENVSRRGKGEVQIVVASKLT